MFLNSSAISCNPTELRVPLEASQIVTFIQVFLSNAIIVSLQLPHRDET